MLEHSTNQSVGGSLSSIHARARDRTLKHAFVLERALVGVTKVFESRLRSSMAAHTRAQRGSEESKKGPLALKRREKSFSLLSFLPPFLSLEIFHP